MIMKKSRLIYVPILIVLTALNGCKKEITVSDELKSDLQKDRLQFTRGEFESIYSRLQKEFKVKPAKNVKPFNETLKSLLKFQLNKSQKEVSEAIGLHVNLSKKASSINQTSTIGKTSGQIAGDNNEILYPAIVDELIEDNALKSLLNERGEIQVGNILYKVTPYGTFFANVSKEAALKASFDNLSRQNDITVRLVNPSSKLDLRGLSVKPTRQKDVLQLNNDVFFIDTFHEAQLKVPAEPEDDGGGGGGGGYTPVNTDPYGVMSDEYIEFKTGGGSITQTLFTNSTRYNYFDSEYRISVLFYDRNYGIVKTLGLKVKLQKQGWFWWNKVDAQEIRAGWDYIVYKQTNSIPQISRPANQSPTIYSPYTINPYDAPVNGWFTPTAASLYTWKFSKSNNELFSIVIPDFLIPPSNEVTISSSAFKPLVQAGWNKLKSILTQSVPISSSGNASNFKFPVYDISDGSKKYLSINDMENLPKAFNSAPSTYQQIAAGQKIRSFISPYERTEYNTDIIDIPLDFSTATISLSQNLNSPLSFNNTLNSLGVNNLDSSYEVEKADIFGTVKHNGRWLGIRIHVNIKP